MVRVFDNGSGDWSSIAGRVISKAQKMVLDAFFLNSQYYNVMIRGKWSNPKESNSALRYTSVSLLLKREPSFRS